MEISQINVNESHRKATSVFPGELAAKNLPANAVDTGSIPEPGVSHVSQSSWAHAPQLLSQRSRAGEPQLLNAGTTTTAAHTPRAHNIYFISVQDSRYKFDFFCSILLIYVNQT